MPGSAKYMSVFEKLKSEILEGKYRSARVFPSSTVLARRFKTTRATVRRALDLLRNQGLVGSQQRRGNVRDQGREDENDRLHRAERFEVRTLPAHPRGADAAFPRGGLYARLQRRRPASRTLRPGSRFHRQHPGDGVAGMFNRGGFCNYLRFVASDQRHKEGKNR